MKSDHSIAAYFAELPDPRMRGKCDHRLEDIVLIAICAVVCGAESWEEIETFGETKEAWLRQWLELPNGIPSHDTFERVFRKLDAKAFEERFLSWVQNTFRMTAGQVVAIDGKSLRGTGDDGRNPNLHLVSAWATANGISLGQKKVKNTSNEITAIPELLSLLLLKGCLVTIDAMGCQTEIAEQIIQQQADYVLAVKGNQGTVHEHIQKLFAYADDGRFPQFRADYAETVDRGHDREEKRCCWALADQYPQTQGWRGCQTIVRVIRERTRPGKTERETVYYVSSLPPRASLLLGGIRAHWGIENSFHWVLDAVFHEDHSRTRTGDSAENLALLRRIARNLFKRHQGKGTLKGKRYRAALDEDFLLQLLLS
jgi:predicted transposase YbfD/YdcC